MRDLPMLAERSRRSLEWTRTRQRTLLDWHFRPSIDLAPSAWRRRRRASRSDPVVSARKQVGPSRTWRPVTPPTLLPAETALSAQGRG
jgi:hypothetical protein